MKYYLVEVWMKVGEMRISPPRIYGIRRETADEAVSVVVNNWYGGPGNPTDRLEFNAVEVDSELLWQAMGIGDTSPPHAVWLGQHT